LRTHAARLRRHIAQLHACTDELLIRFRR
jgi:hypothetical protein